MPNLSSARMLFVGVFVLSVLHLASAKVRAVELFRLTPADATSPSDFLFGDAVALDGNFALVGAPNDSSPPTGLPGAAYVFDVNTGQQLSKLTALDSELGDYFGYSVALNGNLALVGAKFSNASKGAAYLFNAMTGQQLHKFVRADSTIYSNFGDSVALNGSLALIGSPVTDGAAYVFDLNSGQQLLRIPAPPDADRASFGQSVAIVGNKALVTAPNHSQLAAAYVFDITTGAMLQKVSIPTAFIVRDAVGFSDNTALFNDDGAAVLVDVNTGQQLRKLIPSDVEPDDTFGRIALALDGNLALIASEFDDGAHFASGSAYLFDVTTGNQLARITSSDDASGSGSRFARSVALNGDLALIGGRWIDQAGQAHGAAYLHRIDAVPEPNTVFFIGIVLAPLACRRARRPTNLTALKVRFTSLVIASLAMLCDSSSTHAQSAFFTGLGSLPGDVTITPSLISADGSTIAGYSGDSISSSSKPVRWTRGAGLTELGSLPGYDQGIPKSISANGSTISGYYESVGKAQKDVFRWTSESGIQSLVTLDPSLYSSSISVNDLFMSADGSTVFGNFGMWTPFRWKSETGVTLLPKVVNGVPESNIQLQYGSDDLSTIVGWKNPSNQTVRWTEGQGFQYIATQVSDNAPRDISPDGSAVLIIQGYEYYIWTSQHGAKYLGPTPTQLYPFTARLSDNGKVVIGIDNVSARTFRWTDGSGWSPISPLPGGASPGGYPAMSADASILVGGASGGTDSGLYIWDAVHGSRSLRNVLSQDHGLTAALAGWSLTQVTLLSPDGLTVVGKGINPLGKSEAWIAYLGTPVPEPSTSSLLMLALGATVARRRNRRNRRL